MILRSFAVALAAASLFAGIARAAPLEAYGRLPLIEDAQISPDGSMIAYSVTDGEKRMVIVRRVVDGKTVVGVNAASTKLRGLHWAGSEYLVMVASQTAEVMDLLGPKQEYMLATSLEVATGKQRPLMSLAEDSMNVILDAPQVRMADGEASVILEGVHFVGNRGRNALFRIRLKDGRTRMIEPGFEDTYDWAVGSDGEAIAESRYDQKTGDWKLRLRKNGIWAVAESDSRPMGRPYLAGLGRDGRSVLMVYGSEDDDKSTLREYSLDTGKSTDTVVSDFDSLIRDPVTHALIGAKSLVGDDWRYTFYDPKLAAIWKGVAKAYPGAQVQLVSWSDSHRRLIVQVDEPGMPPAYALVDLDTKRSDWLGDLYAGIKAADVSEVRSVHYKAADGLKITGYLTLPKGRDPKNLPLVVLPHGGPAARDEPGFDWWAQAMASRGYAVLQPNFRGSTGFGEAFAAAGYGEFGHKMQTDLSDGVRDLATKGLIDPKRVCIVGASYGGYAALAGVTLDAGVYRCAVSVSGISDLKRFLDSRLSAGGPRVNSATRYWSQFLGVDGRSDPELAALSPITHARAVAAPVLLIHGKDDTVVLYNQSQIMYDALRKAGKSVQLVTLKDEDHWMSRGATRLQMLQEVVGFLEKNNPPD